MPWRHASPSGTPEGDDDGPEIFESELKRDGYDVITNTTPGAKVNPEHSHPFDVRAMVLKGDLTLNREGKPRP